MEFQPKISTVHKFAELSLRQPNSLEVKRIIVLKDQKAHNPCSKQEIDALIAYEEC